MSPCISFYSPLFMSKKFLVALALPMLALAACGNTTASVTGEAAVDAGASDEAMVEDDTAMENDEPVVEADAEVEAVAE